MAAEAAHAVVLQAHSFRQGGRFDEALALLQPLLNEPGTAHADRVLALDIAAISLLGLGRTQEAEAFWNDAIALAPDHVDAHSNLAIMLKGLGRLTDAEPHFRRALQLRPDAAQMRFQLAWVLFRLQRYAEAEQEYRHVLRVLPDAAEAHNNLGNVLEVLDRLAEAESHVRIALTLKPNLAEAHYNLGSLLRQQQRPDDAESAYRRAIALQPDYHDARFALATLLLSEGRFDEGFALHEARYDHPRFVHAQSRTRLRCAQWQGEPLAGKSVLVWQEDGLGDMIQFARYVPLLKAAGARYVTVACMSALHRFFANADGIDSVLDHETAQTGSHRYDCWTSLLSAPLHFNTTADSIPRPLRVRADARLIEQWSEPLDALPGTFKVGLAWKGNAQHHNDAFRSLPSLDTLAPLWSVEGVSFVSLQKGQGEDEAMHDRPILHLGSSITDFADTAAIIAQLDLVICVDTAVAHLAASMGKPCWVLLPSRDLDWRWMQGRSDSPWYPGNMLLFRQRRHETWNDVVQRMTRLLAGFKSADRI